MSKKESKKKVKKEKDVKSLIEEITEQIEKIDNEMNLKREELFELDVSSKGYPKQRKAINDSLEKLGKKREELQEKIALLLIQKSVQERISSCQPYVSLVKGLLKDNKAVVAEFLGVFVDVILDVWEGIDDQLARNSKISAKNLFRRFKDYQDAGFNRVEAMQLLLAYKASVSESIQKASQKITSAVEVQTV